MFINNRSENVFPVKGDDKVRDIKAELAELGSIKAGLEAEIKEGKAIAAEYLGLDEKVAEKDVELQKLNIEIKKAKIKVEDVEQLKQKSAEHKETIKVLQQETDTLLNLKEGLSKDITNLGEKKVVKEVELQSAITNLEDKFSKDKNAYINWERGAIKKVDEYDEILTIKSEALDKLKNEIEAVEKDLKSLTTKRTKLSSELEGLNISIEDAKKKLNDIMEVSDRYYDDKVAEFEEYKNSEVLKLQERDGDVSNRSKFLDVRENFLRDVKSQLEDKLGKKIDNMNF